MEPRTRPATATAWVDDHLRTAILTARMQPGSKIILSALADELGVSPTPLREALARLAMDGLVELKPHGSALVASVSSAEAAELYELRCLVEPRALHAAILAATDDDRQAWRESFARLSTGAEPIDNLGLHTAFHRSLIAGCPSRWMVKTLVPLQDHSQRIVAASGIADQDYDVKADHEPVLRFALDGRADEAAEWLFVHLDRSRRSIEDYREREERAQAEEATT